MADDDWGEMQTIAEAIADKIISEMPIHPTTRRQRLIQIVLEEFRGKDGDK